VLKSDFGEVDEWIFNDVERPFETIFYIPGPEKGDLDEVAYAMF
jgi:hypothetical protein